MKCEGMKLQKCFVACEKDINVVVRFQYSEIENLPQSIELNKISVPRPAFGG